MRISNDELRNVGSRRQAFTLTELLVAIAAIALLTVGISKIFTSISSLVAIGSAESEINQVARALEKQLRDDFESFNRMRPEETFLAIRMRKIGDLDGDETMTTGQGEIALYLNSEDREADRSDLSNALLASPYEEGSRAVTRRVDEIMFIGFNGANGYTSYQLDPETTAGDSTSQHARIYYGHGLRTVPDADWPPADPTDINAPSVPMRWFIPDGDFGASANPVGLIQDPALSENRFAAIATTPFSDATGRNEFASQWTLGRQPMLLYGGEAAGYATTSGTSLRPRIGARREIAPYIRDLENEQRIDGMDNQLRTEQDLVDDGFMLPDISNYRRIRDGRVDICAMSHLDVRRWIEGADVTTPNSGRPFSTGRLLNIMGADTMDQSTANNSLWIRSISADPEVENRAAVQRAIAGMFSRIQMDPTPPTIARAPKPIIDPPQPEDAIMDLHAALATRCSNFEIAWGDSSTALQDIDVDGDGVIDVARGETLWYDIRTLNPGSGNPIPSTYRNWSMLAGTGLINLQSRSVELWNQTELTADDPTDALMIDIGRVDDGTVSASAMVGSGTTPPTASEGPVYSTLLTGGADNPEDEALVIFPFRQPSGNGWGEAWDKTILLRIRVTLHDSLNRLPEGKDFEFIFTLDPQGF